jgi:hypothetical protein
MEIERVVLKAPFVDIVDNRFCCTAVSAGHMYNLGYFSTRRMCHRCWKMSIFYGRQTWRTRYVKFDKFFNIRNGMRVR